MSGIESFSSVKRISYDDYREIIAALRRVVQKGRQQYDGYKLIEVEEFWLGTRVKSKSKPEKEVKTD